MVVVLHNKEKFTGYSIDCLQKLFDEELKELYEKLMVLKKYNFQMPLKLLKLLI